MIYLTGSSGLIGNALYSSLTRNQFTVQTIPNHLYETWKFDHAEEGILIHLGWNTKDRSMRAQEDSYKKSYTLIDNALKNPSMKVVLLASDSSNQETRSNYGRFRFDLETKFASGRCFFPRVGFVVNKEISNWPLQNLGKFLIRLKIRMVFSGKELKVRTVELSNIINFLQSLIDEISSNRESHSLQKELMRKHITFTFNDFVNYQLLTSSGHDSKVSIRLNLNVILLALRVYSFVVGRRALLLDSLYGLIDSDLNQGVLNV